MQQIFSIISRWFEKITSKRLFYITPSEHNTLGKTAAWCDMGFWYVGNVYDSNDIAYGIAQNGVVEKVDTDLVIKVLTDLKGKYGNLTVYDIGANTGYYGVLAAAKFGAKVHAFEPLREHVACISETSRVNGFGDNLIVHQVALGNKKDRLQISLAGSGSTLTDDFLGNTNTLKRMVEVEVLDSLNLPAPHFIKIDVEGYEWEILQGAQKTIAEHRPVCYIEIAKTFTGRNFVHPHFADLIKFFEELGYQAQRNTPLGLTGLENIPDGVEMYLFTPN